MLRPFGAVQCMICYDDLPHYAAQNRVKKQVIEYGNRLLLIPQRYKIIIRESHRAVFACRMWKMDTLKKMLGLDLPTSTRAMAAASLAMMALTLIAIPLAWFFGGAEKVMGLCIAVSLLAMLAIFAVTTVYVSRLEADRLRQMLAGDHWAHWTYTAAEVQQFSQHETVRTHRDMRFSFVFAIVFGLAVGVLMGLLTRSQIMGLLTGSFAFLLGIALVLQDSGRGKAFVFPGPGACEVYIGQQGVYQPGRFCSFAYLAGVKLENDNPPQTILFYRMTSSYSHRLNPSSNLKTAYNTAPLRVGVPLGREAEAQQLVERFNTLTSSESVS